MCVYIKKYLCICWNVVFKIKMVIIIIILYEIYYIISVMFFIVFIKCVLNKCIFKDIIDRDWFIFIVIEILCCYLSFS